MTDTALKAAAKALEAVYDGAGADGEVLPIDTQAASAAITAYLSAIEPEGIARIIKPYAFKAYEGMVAHCLASGDDAETAKRYADSTYGEQMADARTLATTILSTLYQGS